MYRVEIEHSQLISLHEEAFADSPPTSLKTTPEGRAYLVVGENVPALRLVSGKAWYYVLDISIHDWIESRGYFYTLELETKWARAGYPNYKWFIVFQDINGALLFKLTWGGR